MSELNAIGPGAFISRVPVVVWSHSSAVSPIAGRMTRFWGSILPSVRWAAVSETARGSLRTAARLSDDDVVIIPNPIDRAEVVRDSSRDADLSPVRIAYLSEASESKGFNVLIQAIEKLDEPNIEWRLYTRLDPGTATWESARALRNVRMCGRVQDVALAYQQSDIVFCPSLRESFGRVAAEAMANGIPVVASDIAAFRELIGDNQAGLLFPRGDSVAAARAVARLVRDAELRLSMGAVGKERIAIFDPRLVVPQLERMYGLS